MGSEALAMVMIANFPVVARLSLFSEGLPVDSLGPNLAWKWSDRVILCPLRELSCFVEEASRDDIAKAADDQKKNNKQTKNRRALELHHYGMIHSWIVTVPLRHDTQLDSDSKVNDQLLNKQFQAAFAKADNTRLELDGPPHPPISPLGITVAGIGNFLVDSM